MKSLKKLVTLLLALLMVFCLCACDSNGDTEETTDNSTLESTDTETDDVTEQEPSFKVTAVDENGDAVEGVMLQICNDSTCLAPVTTDANGVANFNIEITDGYKLKVFSCPEGYEYTGEAEVHLESGVTEFTLEVAKVQ